MKKHEAQGEARRHLRHVVALPREARHAAVLEAVSCRALEVLLALVDRRDVDVLGLVGVAEEVADVELEGDQSCRTLRAGGEADLCDAVRVLVVLLRAYVGEGKGRSE